MVLPTIRDPRLQLAAIIFSLQFLGQSVLGFEVSIAQILVSLATCAVIEIGFTFIEKRVIMWPASALLTGNSVAFILRVAGTRHGDWWSLQGADIFMLTASLSLLTKYVLRVGDRHIFNPSNLGLVVCFLIFGTQQTNPQDLYWGPMSPGLAITLLLIVGGGIVIVARLKLVNMVLSFFIGFAVFIGLIAASGHCFTARWHYGPVCGWSLWQSLVLSPEVLVFVFFMMTDPKTSPSGRVARFIYGFGLAFVSALLIAPQQTEFGTKVALLGGLVIMCGVLRVIEPHLPAVRSEGDHLLAWIERAVPLPRRGAGKVGAVGRLAASGAMGVVSLIMCAGLVLVATLPGRTALAGTSQSIDASALIGRPTIPLDSSLLPQVSMSPGASAIDSTLTKAEATQLARDVVEDLLIESRAMKTRDPALAGMAATDSFLRAVTVGIVSAGASGTVEVPSYKFDAITVVRVYDPSTPQSPPVIGVRLVGTVHLVVYTIDPTNQVVGQSDAPYDRVLGPLLVGKYYLLAADYTGRQIG